MSQAFEYRRQFIELSEDIHRELGKHVPPMTHDSDEPLAMEIESSGVAFEIIHTPREDSDRIMVECQFGMVPQEQVIEVLTALLKKNQMLFRSRQARIGIDSETGSIVYSFQQSLKTARATSLLEHIEQTAQHAQAWRTTFYLDGALEEPSETNSLDSYSTQPKDSDTEHAHYRQKFIGLLDELCVESDSQEATSNLAGNEEMMITHGRQNDMQYSLLHSARTTLEYLLECHIGAVPEERTEEALRWFLQLNHDLANIDNNAGFAIDANSGQLLLIDAANIDGTTGEILLEKLVAITGLQASQWRDIQVEIDDEDEDSEEDEERDRPPMPALNFLQLLMRA
jgi:hypothetical protein